MSEKALSAEERAKRICIAGCHEWGRRQGIVGGVACPVCEAVAGEIRAAEAAAVRCAAQVARDFAKHYPISVFKPPPSGEHGMTVDACSAAAIREACPAIADEIIHNLELEE